MSIEGIATSDFQGLNKLKILAEKDQNKALPEVAKQFEAIFLQSMLKAMRMGQHFIDESSPFRGKSEATFQEMLDGQYASSIANSKGVGLADMLTRQLQQNASVPETPSLSQTTVSPQVAESSIPPVHASEKTHDSSVSVIDDFIKSIWPTAKAAASVIGLDPKILVAQAALETGWGKFIAKDDDGSSSNNLFNIKAGNQADSDAVNVRTTEYIANTPVKVNASFRKYASVEHSFNDYIALVKGSDRYQTALAYANNPDMYVSELHKAGYATDPDYSSKILSIYHGDELNQAMQRCGLSEKF
jgi:flagellar protein FlgJ